MTLVFKFIYEFIRRGDIFMENRTVKIYSQSNKKLVLRIIPGHFATNNSHINQYIDLTMTKSRQSEAMEVAKDMAKHFVRNTVVDTIVCLDGCEVIGAFLAQELTNGGIMSMNAHQTIYIISPIFNTNGQMMFRQNNQSAVYNKHILLLAGAVTTGDTLKRSLDCIKYYGGMVQGISTVFSAVDKVEGIEVKSIFKLEDIPDYRSYSIDECPMCKNKHRLEAIVNSYGYTKL